MTYDELKKQFRDTPTEGQYKLCYDHVIEAIRLQGFQPRNFPRDAIFEAVDALVAHFVQELHRDTLASM